MSARFSASERVSLRAFIFFLIVSILFIWNYSSKTEINQTNSVQPSMENQAIWTALNDAQIPNILSQLRAIPYMVWGLSTCKKIARIKTALRKQAVTSNTYVSQLQNISFPLRENSNILALHL